MSRALHVAVILGLLAVGGCGTARRGEPIAGPLALSSIEAAGQQVFMEYCQGCHPGGESGLGPPLTNSPAAVWMQRQQVRLGAGKMPAFARADLSGDELDALCDYLRALKRHRPTADHSGPPSR